MPILFFVLSGFVIAFTTAAKQRGAIDYTKARMARLYSVVVPALLVTLLCDAVGRSINPGAYDGWWFNGGSLLEQVLRALTFSSQVGGENIRIGTNGPFWSVAYEAWYYAAFGIAMFARGWRRVALLLLVMIVAGLPIALLAPCWLMGVALHRLTTRTDFSHIQPTIAWLLVLVPWAIYVLWLAMGLDRAYHPDDRRRAHALYRIRPQIERAHPRQIAIGKARIGNVRDQHEQRRTEPQGIEIYRKAAGHARAPWRDRRRSRSNSAISSKGTR